MCLGSHRPRAAAGSASCLGGASREPCWECRAEASKESLGLMLAGPRCCDGRQEEEEAPLLFCLKAAAAARQAANSAASAWASCIFFLATCKQAPVLPTLLPFLPFDILNFVSSIVALEHE